MKHIQSDGNGGFYVSRAFIVAIGLVMLILGALIPVVSGYVTLENDVANIKVRSDDISRIQRVNVERITDLEKNNRAYEERMTSISRDISEIKSDIKAMRGELKK